MTNDSDLKQAVLDELKWEPSIAAAHIGVTARGGVVSLTGHVENYAEKYRAEVAAGRVKGVRAIVEELEVHLPFDVKKGDDEIASAVLGRLGWLSSIPRDAIKVKVEKGWVTLSGQVEWHYQKDIALREVSGLSGVVGISNDITFKPPMVDTKSLAEDITRALHRASYDPKTIEVTAGGGKVILAGTTQSWHDRAEAELTAWSAPGVTSVENTIAVN